MIKMVIGEDGQAFPQWACDECKKLLDADSANLVWPRCYRTDEVVAANVLCLDCDTWLEQFLERAEVHELLGYDS